MKEAEQTLIDGYNSVAMGYSFKNLFRNSSCDIIFIFVTYHLAFY